MDNLFALGEISSFLQLSFNSRTKFQLIIAIDHEIESVTLSAHSAYPLILLAAWHLQMNYEVTWELLLKYDEVL